MTKPPMNDALVAQAAAPAKKTVQMPIGVPGYTPLRNRGTCR